MEAYEYTYVRNKVLNVTGVDLNCYHGPQMQRRLAAYLAQSRHSNWLNFFRAVSNDPTELKKFKDYLSINVSSFFQDREKFEHLQKSILPQLIRTVSLRHPKLHVWCVRCAHGHEPYSLAILLAEATGLYRRHYILATEEDHSAITYARAGGPYSAEEVATVSPHLLDRYFDYRSNGVCGDGYYVIESLRRKVTFRRQNLLTDSFENGFDLIVCRNAAPHLAGNDHLYRRFHDALRPGGVLFVGDDDKVMSQASDLGFETAGAPLGVSFYRRKEQ
jgi:chemotaxis protein methyltransferase CheR